MTKPFVVPPNATALKGYEILENLELQEFLPAECEIPYAALIPPKIQSRQIPSIGFARWCHIR